MLMHDMIDLAKMMCAASLAWVMASDIEVWFKAGIAVVTFVFMVGKTYKVWSQILAGKKNDETEDL